MVLLMRWEVAWVEIVSVNSGTAALVVACGGEVRRRWSAHDASFASASICTSCARRSWVVGVVLVHACRVPVASPS